MKDSFLYQLYAHFRATFGFVSTVVSIVLTFVVWKFLADDKIRLIVVVPFCLFLLVVIATLISLSVDLYKKGMIYVIPKIIKTQAIQNDNLIILLKPNDFFSHGIIVSIFELLDGEFEVLVAHGVVINIQNDKKIQIGEVEFLNGYEQLKQELINNNVTFLNRIIIKPVVSRSY